jgi:hypothetical protein
MCAKFRARQHKKRQNCKTFIKPKCNEEEEIMSVETKIRIRIEVY